MMIDIGAALEDRTKVALTAMRKILRTTEMNSKRLTQETGLTPSLLIFMHMLDDEREQTAGYVASRMGITQATTTALMHKLEAQGMIARRKGETDRRQVWLSLTPAGRKILQIAPDGVHARFRDQFAALEDWEQAMLVSALERVAAMLGNDEQGMAAVLDANAVLSSD